MDLPQLLPLLHYSLAPLKEIVSPVRVGGPLRFLPTFLLVPKLVGVVSNREETTPRETVASRVVEVVPVPIMVG